MMHIIIFPYYCNAEINVYREIARIWNRITHTKVAYEFLLISRFDMKPSAILQNEFSTIAPTRSIQSQREGKGVYSKGEHACGPSVMFWDAMRYVSDNYIQDGGFALWFESDMIPIRDFWLDALDNEWRAGHYVMLGRLIDRDFVKKQIPGWLSKMVEHINGGACYCKDFNTKIPMHLFDLRYPWDAEIFHYVRTHYQNQYKFTQLIEFRYRRPTMEYLPDMHSVLLHGVKDASARKYTIRKSYHMWKIFYSLKFRVPVTFWQ